MRRDMLNRLKQRLVPHRTLRLTYPLFSIPAQLRNSFVFGYCLLKLVLSNTYNINTMQLPRSGSQPED